MSVVVVLGGDQHLYMPLITIVYCAFAQGGHMRTNRIVINGIEHTEVPTPEDMRRIATVRGRGHFYYNGHRCEIIPLHLQKQPESDGVHTWGMKCPLCSEWFVDGDDCRVIWGDNGKLFANTTVHTQCVNQAGGLHAVAEQLHTESNESNETKYVIVRGDRSSPFIGQLVKHDGQHVTLTNARRLWYWEGAASLSQLAIDGTSRPGACIFPEALEWVKITDAIEIMPVTEKARKSIDAVKVWKA